MSNFEIITTHEQLKKFASYHDGMCKVALTKHGTMAIEPDRELGFSCEWDYYMSDEADCFNFKKFGIKP